MMLKRLDIENLPYEAWLKDQQPMTGWELRERGRRQGETAIYREKDRFVRGERDAEDERRRNPWEIRGRSPGN